MKKYISSVLAAALVSTLMVGCSDDNDDNSNPPAQDVGFNGIFVDRQVDGVSFSCPGVDGNPLQGTTHDGGEFGVCATGSTVSFSVGNLVLGSMAQTNDNIFTPRGIAGGDNDAANQIASLVLSLSTSSVNAEGETVLTIGTAAIEALNLEVVGAIDIATISAETLSETIEAVVSNETTDLEVVTPEEAESHMNEVAEEISDGTIVAPHQPEVPATTGSVGVN